MTSRISIVAATILAFLLALIVVGTAERLAPVGTRTVITVWDTGEQLTRSEAGSAIAEAARSRDLSVYKVSSAVGDGRITRTLFVMNRLPDSRLPDPGAAYPDLGRDLTTDLAPRAALPDAEVNGMYVTDADAESSADMARHLTAQGLAVSVSPFGMAGVVLWAAAELPVVPVASTALLMVVLGCVHQATLHRRRCALEGVAGGSVSTIVARAVAQAALLTAAVGVAGGAVGMAALALSGRSAQSDRFVVAGVVAVGVVLGLVLVSTATATTVVSIRSLPRYLADRAVTARFVAGVGAVHVLVLGLVVAMVPATTGAVANVAANARDREVWTSVSDYYSVAFRSSDSESAASEAAVAAVVRGQLDHDRALIAYRGANPEEAGPGPGEGGSIIVNDRFFAEVPVVTGRGTVLRSSDVDSESMTLLIPEGLEQATASIVDAYREWLDEQASGRAVPPVAIRVVPIEAGQEVFDFATWAAERSAVVDPVVAVLPSSGQAVSDNWLAAAVTSAEVLFLDPRRLEAALADAGLVDQIGGIDSVRSVAESRIAAQTTVLRGAVALSGLAALSLLTSAALLGGALAEQFRRTTRLRLRHGAAVARIILAPTATLTVGGAIAIAVASRSSGIAGGAAPLVIVVDVVVVAAILAVARLRASAIGRASPKRDVAVGPAESRKS